jgi:hypothetical protein
VPSFVRTAVGCWLPSRPGERPSQQERGRLDWRPRQFCQFRTFSCVRAVYCRIVEPLFPKEPVPASPPVPPSPRGRDHFSPQSWRFRASEPTTGANISGCCPFDTSTTMPSVVGEWRVLALVSPGLPLRLNRRELKEHVLRRARELAEEAYPAVSGGVILVLEIGRIPSI